MKLTLQKRLAGELLKCSPKRVKFDPSRLNDISEAITKTDIRELIGEGAIIAIPKKGVSRARANYIANQKKKGQRKGHGSRKGAATARLPKKEKWMLKVRVQRRFLKELKDKDILDNKVYRKLYSMVKGGFFRSRRHIKLVMEERELTKR